MDTPEVKETDYLKAWAAFFACAAVGGALAGAVTGGILGGFLGVAGVPTGTIKLAGAAVGFLVSLPISYFFFRFFVSRIIVEKLRNRQALDESVKSD